MGSFWEKNRDFLTKILTGAAVFLVLSYLISSLGSEGSGERRERKGLMKRRSVLLRQRRNQGGVLSGSTEDLVKALKQRAMDVCVGVPQDLDKEKRLPVRFVAERQNVCRNLNSLASDAAVIIKTTLPSVDFHERDSDDVEKYKEHWAALESFKRLLEAAIKAGFFEIQSIVSDPVMRTVIKDDPQWSIARYKISMEVTGKFDSFVNIFSQVNKPGKFVLVHIDTLKRKTGEKPFVLEGLITGYGIRLEKTKKVRTKGSGSGFFPVRNKR